MRYTFHVVYVTGNEADVNAHDIAVADDGSLIFIDEKDEAFKQIAAGQWIEWETAHG